MITLTIRIDSRTGYIDAAVEKFRETDAEVMIASDIKNICIEAVKKFDKKITEEDKNAREI